MSDPPPVNLDRIVELCGKGREEGNLSAVFERHGFIKEISRGASGAKVYRLRYLGDPEKEEGYLKYYDLNYIEQKGVRVIRETRAYQKINAFFLIGTNRDMMKKKNLVQK